MPPAPPAWPRPDGAGGASAPTSRSLSAPPSRVGATPQRARVRPPSRPPPWGRSTGHRRTEASQAARATAPEAQGAARSARSHCADASHPGPRGHGRCSGPAVAQSSATQSSSPRRHPRSCAPALTTRSPGSAASQSDHGPTGASLPDPRRSDAQQPAPWPASATHGAPAYPLLNNPGSLNPSSSPGARISLGDEPFGPERWDGDQAVKAGVDAPEPALEQGGEGSGIAPGSAMAGLFSAGVGRWAASHMPVDTAQNSANAMTRMRRSSRPGSLIWLSSSPKPRLLKSENMASMPQRRPSSKAVWTEGACDRAMIQGSGWPASCTMATLVRTGTVRIFVCGLGMNGTKEPNHAQTQRTTYS